MARDITVHGDNFTSLCEEASEKSRFKAPALENYQNMKRIAANANLGMHAAPKGMSGPAFSY